MKELVELFDQWAWLIKFGALITAIGIIYTKLITPLIIFIKKVVKVVNDLEEGYPVLEEIVKEFSKDRKLILKEKFDAIEKDMWLRRERHRLYMELDNESVFEMTDDGQCIWVSESWMLLFGQNAVEASGNGWLAGVNSLDRDKVTSEWETALKQKRQFKMKFRVKENGKTTWVKCTALPIKDSSGHVYGYLGKITLVQDKPVDFSEAIHD